MESVIAIYTLQKISLDTGCITYGTLASLFVIAADHFTQWIEVGV